MNLKDSMRKFFGVEEGSAEEDYVGENKATVSLSSDSVVSSDGTTAQGRGTGQVAVSEKVKAKVIPISQKNISSKTSIHLIEPRVYSESQRIADYLLNNESILLNFKRMDHDQSVKMIDFIMGTVYAIQGDIQKVGDEIFLCTPPTVEIAGLETEDYEDFYRR